MEHLGLSSRPNQLVALFGAHPVLVLPQGLSPENQTQGIHGGGAQAVPREPESAMASRSRQPVWCSKSLVVGVFINK